MKSLSVIIQISKTHLLNRKKQTVTAILGVVFGIGTFIFLTSVMTGLNEFMQDVLLDKTPHIHLFNDMETQSVNIIDKKYDPSDHVNIVRHVKPKMIGSNLKDGMRIVDVIRKDDRVYGVSGSVTTQVFYKYGPIEVNGSIVGVKIKEEDKLFDISKTIVKGELSGLMSSRNGVLMGFGLSEKLNVKLNDVIRITTPGGKNLPLTVVGIFRSGVAQIDKTQCYANLSTVQKILGKGNDYITDIKIKLNDLDQSGEMAKKYHEKFGYTAVDWKQANATVLTSFQLNDMMLFFVVAILLLVAGFGIYNILTMLIFQKMKDIAILKSMGFSAKDVLSIFLSQALIIGIVGALLGMLLGFLLSYAVSVMPYQQEEFFYIESYPVKFDSSFYIMGLFYGILTTALAGYFPSRKAAKADPISIIRS